MFSDNIGLEVMIRKIILQTVGYSCYGEEEIILLANGILKFWEIVFPSTTQTLQDSFSF